MFVRDIDPSQIQAIHVDRTEDGVVMPRVWQGNPTDFVRFFADHELSCRGRLLWGGSFRIILKQQVAVFVDLIDEMDPYEKSMGLWEIGA